MTNPDRKLPGKSATILVNYTLNKTGSVWWTAIVKVIVESKCASSIFEVSEQVEFVSQLGFQAEKNNSPIPIAKICTYFERKKIYGIDKGEIE